MAREISEIDLQGMGPVTSTSSEEVTHTHDRSDAIPLVPQRAGGDYPIHFPGTKVSPSSAKPLHQRFGLQNNTKRNEDEVTLYTHLPSQVSIDEPAEVPSEGNATEDDGWKQDTHHSWLSRLRVTFSPGMHFVNRFKIEPTKEVCSRNRRSALQKFAIFHLPAISVTITLLSLYIIGYKWEGPTSEQLSALQFAAKGHEALILMSLADILLHRITYGLLCPDSNGIPLGFLSSAFYLPSPLRYLFSWEFWGAGFNPRANRPFHVITSGLILLLTLISLGAGPLSAILMIPRAGWRELHVDLGDPWYIDEATYGIPYPMTLPDSTKASEQYCRLTSQEPCKSQNLHPIFDHIWKLLFDTVLDTRLANISLTRYGLLSIDRPISLFTFSTSTAIGTGPMAFLSYPLFSDITNQLQLPKRLHPNRKHLLQSKPSGTHGSGKWKQPLVAVECQPNSTSPQPETWKFWFWTLFDGTIDLKADLRNGFKSLSHSTSTNGSRYSRAGPIYLSLEHDVPAPLSAAMLFINNSTSYICLIQARWKDADVWITSQSRPAVQIDLGIAMDDIPSYLNETSNTQNIIKMPYNTLMNLRYIPNAQNTTVSSSAYQEISAFCVLFGLSFESSCLAWCLATYFVDHLTLSSYWGPDSSDSDPWNLENINITHNPYEYVYSYSSQGSHIIIIAFAVLLLHTIVSIVHFGIILFSKNPWHSSAWRDFGQLMALALRSRSPRGLQNVGGGVQSSETWKEVLYVRDVMNTRRLEMVIADIPEGVGEEVGTDPTYHFHSYAKVGAKYA